MRKKTKRTLRNIGLYYALSPKKNKKLTDSLAFNELVRQQPLENKVLGYSIWKEFGKSKKKKKKKKKKILKGE